MNNTCGRRCAPCDDHYPQGTGGDRNGRWSVEETSIANMMGPAICIQIGMRAERAALYHILLDAHFNPFIVTTHKNSFPLPLPPFKGQGVKLSRVVAKMTGYYGNRHRELEMPFARLNSCINDIAPF